MAENGTLKIDADPTGASRSPPSTRRPRAGGIEFVMENQSTVQHNIAVKDGGIDQKGPVVGQGGTSELTASLKPGEYIFYCSVPGHEEGGMKGNLTVE